MSRSRKKAILKDKGNSDYNKIIRRVNKSIVKQFKTNYQEIEPLEYNEETEEYFKPEFFDGYTGFYLIEPEQQLKNLKEIVNQYTICDYKWNIEYNNDSWAKQRDLDSKKIKYRRK